MRDKSEPSSLRLTLAFLLERGRRLPVAANHGAAFTGNHGKQKPMRKFWPLTNPCYESTTAVRNGACSPYFGIRDQHGLAFVF